MKITCNYVLISFDKSRLEATCNTSKLIKQVVMIVVHVFLTLTSSGASCVYNRPALGSTSRKVTLSPAILVFYVDMRCFAFLIDAEE